MKKQFLAAGAVAAVGLGMVVPATNAAAASMPITDATFTWQLSACAFSGAYVTTANQSSDSCGSIRETQPITGSVTKEADGWRFTGGTGTYDPYTGATELAFTGSVQVGNTNRGGYSIAFRDPEVNVAADGTGEVTATVAYKTSAAGETTTVDDVTIVTLADVPDAASWSVTPPWAGVGTPDATAPLDGKQFAPELIAALPDSLKNWFRASSSAEATQTRTEYNSYKAPAPVSVDFAEPTITPTLTITGADGIPVNRSRQITIHGTGFDPRANAQGVYVVFGPNAAVAPGGYTNTGLYGDAQYLPTAPDANGEFTTTLTVRGRYTDADGREWNGRADALGVSTWAAHSHATTAYDTFARVTFDPAVKAASTTTLRTPAKVRAGAKLRVAVKVATTGRARGPLRVRVDGTVVRTVTLRPADQGTRTLTLPGWKGTGRHRVQAVFAGNDGTKRSASPVRTVVVKKG